MIAAHCLSERTVTRIKQLGFNKATLDQVFVLAQVLIDHHPITVRGAFYRAVSSGAYPNTDEAYYRQASNIVLKLRRGGLIPYDWVPDSTRLRLKSSSWSGLEDFGDTVRDCYRKDFWAGQSGYIEFIVEKDAMAGVLRPVTDEFDVHLNVIRGNSSETFVWTLAEALKDIEKPISLYYLGDHDPNGLDIERDLQTRLRGFLGTKEFTWQRLGITGDDFKREDLLGFPVRPSGSKSWRRRTGDYIEQHGDRCVEIDAIPPAEIRQRLRDTIEGHIDQGAWERLRVVERAERETINKVFGKSASR